MRKILIFAVGLTLLITGSSWATAIVQTTDYISFPVVALDSVTGVECVPESVHIHVWRGSLTNTTVYSNREVGDGADLAQIDSVATGYAGAVPQQYYFHDKVEDIDGDGTAGVYTINVRLWRGTTPTSNWFSFQILTNSLNDAITAATVTLDDSLGAAKQAIAAVIDDSLGNAKNLIPGISTATLALLDDSLGGLKNSLTKAFDGDTTWGTNPMFTVERVFVRPEAGNTDAVFVKASGTGSGIEAQGDEAGIYALGTDIGLRARATAGAGILGLGTTAGMELQGSSTDDLVLGFTGHIRGWMDSVLYIESVSSQITAIQAYLGAGDSWRQHLLPFATANKDSIRTFEAGTCISTIYLYKDDSDATVLDSITQEIW